MSMLRYITAGESHGKALIGILEGIPSGLSLAVKDIDTDLQRRQGGYGRGGRMKIESDHAEILSGVRWGKDHRLTHFPPDREQGLGELA